MNPNLLQNFLAGTLDDESFQRCERLLQDGQPVDGRWVLADGRISEQAYPQHFALLVRQGQRYRTLSWQQATKQWPELRQKRFQTLPFLPDQGGGTDREQE